MSKSRTSAIEGRQPTSTNGPSQAEVFIIESLRRDDRKRRRKEGSVLQAILKMGGRNPIYRYCRTLEEVRDAIAEFSASDYRYIHLSCHGDETGFEFEFGVMGMARFAKLLNGCLSGRRLFISACGSVNRRLARELFPDSRCYSLIGPNEEIDFDEAAVLFATYYFMAFRNN